MSVYFNGNVIGEWDKRNSYSIGDIVKYNEVKYVAITDVPVGINIGMSTYWKREETIIPEYEFVYSEEEQYYGKWVNGDDVYYKTVKFTIENGDENAIDLKVDIKRFVDAKISLFDSTTDNFLLHLTYYVSSADKLIIWFPIDRTTNTYHKLAYQSGSSRPRGEVYCTVFYTKED